MSPPTSVSTWASASAARLQAIVGHGFTQRQATFLALVMRHSGVCVPRQYAQIAGIAQGAKCTAFFERLVRRGHARAIECVHNRARLYLVHSTLLYRAIGEPTSRYRRPVSPRLALEHVMLLDALLSTPVSEWLTTASEKAAALPLPAMRLPEAFPIGLQSDGRIVVLYLAPEPCADAFRRFVRAHAPLLEVVPAWTLRIVLPRRFASAHDAYQRAVHDELESSLSPATMADLKRYFERRKTLFHAPGDRRADDIFRADHQTFSTPRFDDLYRRWIKHGDEVFSRSWSGAITAALESGAGRVESFVLPHSYRHLSPLVGQSRSTAEKVEEGVEKIAHGVANARRRSQPRTSTPWRSHERSVLM